MRAILRHQRMAILLCGALALLFLNGCTTYSSQSFWEVTKMKVELESNNFRVRQLGAQGSATCAYLFGSGLTPTCLDTADANDDGAVDLADAIVVLSHLFDNAGPLPEPFGACGSDPTLDDLECSSCSPCE